jgi:type I restriction enzyme S subunit
MSTDAMQVRDASPGYGACTGEADVPVGYKTTKVGVIPGDWEVLPCSELSDRIMVGIVIRPTQYYAEQGVPAFRSANIREDGIVDTDLVFISEASNALLAKSQTRTGDVLTVRTGYPGTSAVVRPAHAGCNCIDILITRPSEKLDSDYLAIWINSSFGKEQVLRNQGGLAQKHFNVGDMRNLVVALPPIPEQRAIAEALSDVDGLLGALDALIVKKRAIKQAAMQQLLTGKTRLPGFSGEWETRPLAEDVTLLSGHHVMARHSNTRGDGTPYLTGPADFADGRIQQTKCTVKPATLCRPGDILVTVKGSGSGTLIEADGEYCISRQLMAIRTCYWNAKFLFYSLLQNACRIAAASTGLIPGLSRADILEQELPLPSEAAEQAAIATVLSDMDAEIAALERRRDKTRAIKQGMMQQLLTGRVRLVKPAHEGAGA